MARPRSDIKTRIVEAARSRFLEAGVDGASLREIARDAHTNIGMIVYYFPSKDDLFLAVVEETYAPFLADLASALAGDDPVSERLQRAFIRMGRCSERELEVVRLVLREVLLSSTRFRRIVSRFMRGHVPLLLKTVSDGVARGELDATVPPPMLLIVPLGLGALPQLLRRAATEIPPLAMLPQPEELAALSKELLVRAIGAPPRQRDASDTSTTAARRKPSRKRRG
ncbi:MAG: TetR/AcrR family transcriptional regulator [Polyangiaceae bacterium]